MKTKGGRDDYIDHNIIQINHYFCKSREEWIFKRLRGMADKPPDKKYRPDNNFDAHDQNEEEDGQTALVSEVSFLTSSGSRQRVKFISIVMQYKTCCSTIHVK